MLGLLYSHVDPPNSLVCVCLCLLSEGQWIRTPNTCSTQLAGHSSGAPHSCQRAGSARFIIVSEFRISGLWGQKLMLTFWVTSCFTVRKFQPDRSIFMNWFKFWHCTWVPTRYRGRQSVYPIQISYSCLCGTLQVLQAREECSGTSILACLSFKGYFYTDSKLVSDIV